MAGELTRLGQVLQQGTRDYMGIQLANKERDDQRAERLADTQSARDYADKRFQVERTAHMQDQQQLMDLQENKALLQVLFQHGYLAPGDEKDPAKIADAFKRAQEDGLVDRYRQLIEQGYLAPTDVNDHAKVQAAEAALGARGAQTLKDTDTAKSSATAEVTRLRDEGLSTSQRIHEIERQLSQATPEPTPQQISQRAQQIATDINGGKTPSQQQIIQASAQAEKELRDLINQQTYMETKDLQSQLQSLRYEQQDNRARQNDLTDRFHVAPAAPPAAPAAPASMAAPRAPAQVTPEQRAKLMGDAIAGALGQQGGAPASAGTTIPTAMQPLANPQSEPLIDQENQRRAQRFQMQTVQQPLQEAQQRLADLDRQIDQVRQQSTAPAIPGGGATRGTSTNAWGIPSFTGVGPSTTDLQSNQAAQLSQLFQQRQLTQKQVADLAARLKNPTVGPMAINPTTQAPVYSNPPTNAQTPSWLAGQLTVAPAY